MLEQVLLYLYGNRPYNWPITQRYCGKISVTTSGVALPLVKDQYFRIVGSVFNDGVYKYGEPEVYTDEVFNGEVWALAIPKALLELVNEIKAWNDKNGEVATGPYQSESFGGYSYTKATDAASGEAVTWQSAFRAQLNRWRKI